MKSRSIKCKKLHPLMVFKQAFYRASLDKVRERKFFGRNPLKLGRKVTSILTIAIIVIMLVSVFAWLSTGTQSKPNFVQPESNGTIAAPSPTGQQTATPTPSKTPTGILDIGQVINQAVTEILIPPKPPGLIELSQNANSTMWKEVAAIAWRYFKPGMGVNSKTGLPGSSDEFSAFTDWDLGVYIQAVIDAQKLGLIGTDGAWNSSARLELVVRFLETRELNSTTNYPYWFYQAKDGGDYHAISDLSTSYCDVIDTGRLFVALNNLRLFNSSLVSRINDIVLFGQLYNRTDYAALVPSIYAECQSSTSIYAYYVYSGFASFWPSVLSSAVNTIMNNIWSAGNVSTPEGVSLPNAALLGDPLLCSVFELSNNNSQLMALTRQVYLAHEAYYNATGKYRAFSEGPSFSGNWVYEWVVWPDNRTWIILDEHNAYSNISPIIYTSIAMSFLSIFNTTYAHDMVVNLERALPDPTDGYCIGVDESGAKNINLGLNSNGLIVGAAKYAIRNNP